MKPFFGLASLLLLSTVTLSDERIVDTFTEDFGGPKPGFRYKVKDLSIEGEGNVFYAEPGSQVYVEMDVLHDCTSCGNAINQIIVGLSSDHKAQVSVWNGKQRSGGGVKVVNSGTSVECLAEDNDGEAEWVTVGFQLTVPDQLGDYYIRTRYSQAYTGNLLTEDGRQIKQRAFEEPLKWWKVDRPSGPGEQSNIGKIIVESDTPLPW
ncbi:hypothetical protein [Endozoicomonas elysicola]|uniref:Uncharacterized protein n=1 Tax=Endozoicomonas elysicola TaxID=305900 RepID=A0A081KAT6_9GAMM|nr:hypothetical protein [Endozoicomonas elysicola]KEI71262.1 hypothetical protein GV64_11370 [Endozoicomonas elysicola]